MKIEFLAIPWCVIGDFNDLLHVDDKKGCVPHPNWLYRGFRETVAECDLFDLSLNGYNFTWSRCKGTEDKVDERLDRAYGRSGMAAIIFGC
ncbi:hypothetical protein PTKIN_Ptkin06aG0210600 [Pterospermum kingtungense]